MGEPEATDFNTDFSARFDSPLRPVDVVSGLDVETFQERYAGPGIPVIFDDQVSAWPALERWTDSTYLTDIAGDRTVFARDLDAGQINQKGYREVYRSMPFSAFVESVTGQEPAPLYLTQGIILRARGSLRALERRSCPAWLPELADDLELPQFLSRQNLLEANLWMGPGGQTSALHFDECDNLNGIVAGAKRWLLFPADQSHDLLAGGGNGRQTIARGYHAKESGCFEPTARRSVSGFECVTQAGQMLFIPAGMWHQVFSGPGLSMAVNFWYLNLRSDAMHFAALRARRLVGFRARKRLPVVTGVVLADMARLMMMQMLRRGDRAPTVGPARYR